MQLTRDQLIDALFKSFFEVRKNKGRSMSQLEFEFDFEYRIFALADALLSRTYDPGEIEVYVGGRLGDREIFVSHFAHRVVGRMLYDWLVPVFEPMFIHDSFSGRKGKGVRQARERFERHLCACTQNWTRPAWVLKADIYGCYPSIERRLLHRKVLSAFDRGVRRNGPGGVPWSETLDADLIRYLLDITINRDPTRDCHLLVSPAKLRAVPAHKSLFRQEEGRGVAIGEVTTALYVNVLLNDFDQWVKRRLHCRYYGRYADDFYVADPSREHLAEVAAAMDAFLRDELHIRMHPEKTRIIPARHGTEFVGAYFKPWRQYARTPTVKQFRDRMYAFEQECLSGVPPRARLAAMRNTINSYLGYLRPFKTYNILSRQFIDSPLQRYFYFTPGYTKAILKHRYRDQ